MIDDVTIVVPTFNAGDGWHDWVEAYKKLSNRPKCFIVDSSSTDETVHIAIKNGLTVKTIDGSTFDHGGTRNDALAFIGSKFIVFMTQDAILVDSDSVGRLLRPFDDRSVAAVCGRQLHRPQAGVFEKYSRYNNYPAESSVRSYKDRAALGLKTAFMSNSFAAYRRDVLESVGGFPEHQIFGEDMCATAKMLKAGWKIAYAADACVYHSHDYSMLQEMKRYFDMGVFHSRESWICAEFGDAEKEGGKFVLAELKYLLHHAPWRIPEGISRTIFKYTGYRLGLWETHIPLYIKKKICMNPVYFKSIE